MRYSIRTLLVMMFSVAVYSTIAVKVPQLAIVIASLLLTFAIFLLAAFVRSRGRIVATYLLLIPLVLSLYVTAFLAVVAIWPLDPPVIVQVVFYPIENLVMENTTLGWLFTWYFSLCR
jgi:hypothetical protein